jgi:hypothetical protein
MTTKKPTKVELAQAQEKINKEHDAILKKAFNELVGEKTPEGLTCFEMQLRVSYRHVIKSYQQWLESVGDDLTREGKNFKSKMGEGDFEYLHASPPIQSMGSRLDGMAERLMELKNIIKFYLAGKFIGQDWK